MEANSKKVVMILVGVALLVAVLCILSKKESFSRTCLTANDNCQFVRSHVDYAYEEDTSIPYKKGWVFPHWLADPSDERQPLDKGPVNLIKDEGKLWDQGKLWSQYGHDWKGCGDGKTYITNDPKTRFLLTEVGDEWLHRILNGKRDNGDYGGDSVLTEQSMITPEPYERMYGGPDYVDTSIGD